METDEANIIQHSSFVGPFTYDANGQIILDARNNPIVEMRGWGHLSNLPKNEKLTAEDIQDGMGKIVAGLMTEAWKKHGRII
jgi:hypothetical protein